MSAEPKSGYSRTQDEREFYSAPHRGANERAARTEWPLRMKDRIPRRGRRGSSGRDRMQAGEVDKTAEKGVVLLIG